ncbi:MAG: hypothetical protein DSZ31_05705 [Gammaproteobacteria bacterium]|nr:MAG: hypothetical protein DSZ31_05705 [Gammaproteobacteria bacterium]RTZ68380.1 MAG: hypothetical protein DSZ30_04310 [Aquificaceae bacterium]
MIFSFLGFTAFSQPFCGVEVENPFPLQRGFISSYLNQKVFETLIETGFVQDCKKGKPVLVRVKRVDFKGSSISGNRFSGYTFYLSFDIVLPKETLSYSLSKYVSLPDPSLGTLPIRSAMVDLLETYQMRIKKDLLEYKEKFKDGS